MKSDTQNYHCSHNTSRSNELQSPADKSGLPPGSLVHIGEKYNIGKISVTQYNPDKLIQKDISSIKNLEINLDQDEVMTWINISGLSNTKLIEDIGQKFHIHPLILEDILSTHQRPKMEDKNNYIYLVIKGVHSNNRNNIDLKYEQISILLMKNCVISFKEKFDDTFDSLYKRLENEASRLRKINSDYLAYAIIDTIIDEYFVIQDSIDGVIDPLEDSLLNNPSDNTLAIIQQLRRELITMKRNILPIREVLTKIQHSDSDLVKVDTLHFFDDVRDHVIRFMDSLESYRERITAMHDIYLTSISNKMNETMKILTIFASIFIPLTFIAGIYGMNFEYMPELKWRWAYPVLWILFIGISLALIIFFKKKKWL